MALLKPRIAMLDETDSGLDIDALKIVANGVNALVGPNMGALVITHYQRILNYVTPDFVHVFVDGRIVAGTTVPYEVPLMRASEIRTMSFTPFFNRRAGTGAAPHSGMPGRAARADVLEHEHGGLVDRQRRIVDAPVQVGVVLEDDGAAPVGEQLR